MTRADLGEVSELLSRSCRFDKASHVADSMCFAAGADGVAPRSVVAQRGETIAGLMVVAGRHIRVVAVSPDYRRHGLGSSLLDDGVAHAMSGQLKELRTLAQPGNYLAPGIEIDNVETIAWLQKRGFIEHSRNTNLIVDVTRANPKVSRDVESKLRAKCTGYRFERLLASDLKRWQDVVTTHFSKGWAFEIGLSCQQALSGVHVAYDPSGQPAAFAAHDGNNQGLGWFGPTGTFDAHRRKGLAAALLVSCLLDVRDAGHDTCQIAWIGPRGFYEKVSGVIGDRHFMVLSKNLDKLGA